MGEELEGGGGGESITYHLTERSKGPLGVLLPACLFVLPVNLERRVDRSPKNQELGGGWGRELKCRLHLFLFVGGERECV